MLMLLARQPCRVAQSSISQTVCLGTLGMLSGQVRCAWWKILELRNESAYRLIKSLTENVGPRYVDMSHEPQHAARFWERRGLARRAAERKKGSGNAGLISRWWRPAASVKVVAFELWPLGPARVWKEACLHGAPPGGGKLICAPALFLIAPVLFSPSPSFPFVLRCEFAGFEGELIGHLGSHDSDP